MGSLLARFVYPIVAEGDGNLEFFDQADAAVAYMEPWDVRDGVWRAWDATGTRIRVFADDDRGPVQLRLTDDVDSEGLSAALAREAAAMGLEVQHQSTTELLRAVWAARGSTR